MLVGFLSQCYILWIGYLHLYFVAKRLPLLLNILKDKQWLLIKQKKKITTKAQENNPSNSDD